MLRVFRVDFDFVAAIWFVTEDLGVLNAVFGVQRGDVRGYYFGGAVR